MKYQSEIVKQLTEEKGHYKSLPHYESECIEAWVEANKNAYPKLTDYQAEWLNYANEHPIGMFPYETLTDITEATIENVVPYAYKSAILKGQTLVNICKPYEFDIQTTGSGLRHIYDKNHVFNIPIQDDKQYSIWIEIDINEIGAFSLSHTGASSTLVFNDIVGLTLTHGSTIIYPCVKRNNSTNVNFSIGAFAGSTEGRLKGRIMVFEGDIRGFELSYFAGMKSVKMPVLKSIGKNLFDINSMSNINNWDTVVSSEIPYCSYKINLKPNTAYTFSQKEFVNMENVYASFGLEKGGFEYLLPITHPTAQYQTTFTITTDDRGLIYLKLFKANTTLETFISELSNNQLQLEEGIQATSYEPHKSNILTVNEDVTLRGIGDVNDELDCLTGEVTERIGEVVLDGSENWVYEPTYTNENVYGCYIHLHQLSQPPKPSNFNFANNVFPNITNSSYQAEGFATNPSTLSLRIAKTKLESADLSGFKKYLQNQPVTLQYPLATESIKTVGLTVSNQNGDTCQLKPIEGTMYLETSSDTIQPSFSGEIPVEATTQNLASFIEE